MKRSWSITLPALLAALLSAVPSFAADPYPSKPVRIVVGFPASGMSDNLARVIAPGRVVVQEAWGEDDPNAEVLDEIALKLAAMKDAKGRTLPNPRRNVQCSFSSGTLRR